MAARGQQAGGRQTRVPAAGRLLLANGVVLLLILGTAFGVIGSTHDCRQLYAQLQVLEAARWHQQEEYSRLILEQSTWASHYRVEKVAAAELHMAAPALANLKVVSP